ncbi:MAG: hypothetical protein INQ03_06275 [Candidatus Heimdallarchaeota archaeon]|nr:hypothetical protein [Candidatus Heimdallarchaeota archaeon]
MSNMGLLLFRGIAHSCFSINLDLVMGYMHFHEIDWEVSETEMGACGWID